VRGKSPKPYSMGYAGQCLSLARRDGVIQMVRRDDTPRNAFIAGAPAAFVKERICRYAKFGSRTAIYAWIGAGG
jgi:NADH:ubiquinone reductase (H+-translocating)